VPSDPERRIEPWPIALGAALVLMIAVAVAFFLIAEANPDPVIAPEPRPGMER
jgi:hypothetical protein